MAFDARFPFQSTESFWNATRTPSDIFFPTNARDVDVIIVGAGITGLTAAILLQQLGKKVLILEALRIAAGTSGETSAHLSMLLDIPYFELSKKFGREGSQAGAAASVDAIRMIEDFVTKYQIDCGFRRVPGFLFPHEPDAVSKIEKECEIARELGLSCELTRETPLEFISDIALRVDNQAQLHIANYLTALAKIFVEAGGEIAEQTRVRGFDDGNLVVVHTARGDFRAAQIILATHSPIGLCLSLQARLLPYRSYILGVRVREPSVDALYWDTDTPYHYLRWSEDSRGKILLVGGADHRVGNFPDESPFAQLENYVRSRFQVNSIDYRWSSQFYEPADHLPYIGKMPLTKNIFVATGFSGTGLTFGTIAGKILANQIAEKNLPDYAEAFKPSRIKPIASAKILIEENFDVVKNMIGDRLSAESLKSTDLLEAGVGKVLRVDGKMIAAYKDYDGRLSLRSAVCPHAKGIVRWNPAESSWDCSCHGGRFDRTGKLLIGPPMHDLEEIETTSSDATLPLIVEGEG